MGRVWSPCASAAAGLTSILPPWCPLIPWLSLGACLEEVPWLHRVLAVWASGWESSEGLPRPQRLTHRACGGCAGSLLIKRMKLTLPGPS